MDRRPNWAKCGVSGGSGSEKAGFLAGIGINSDIWWQWFEIFRMRLFDAPRVGANAEGGTGIQVRFPVSSQQT